MALPEPLIPNFNSVYSGIANAYALGDEIRKRNLLLQAGQAYAGAPATAAPASVAAQPAPPNALAASVADFVKQQEGYAPVAKWDVRQHSGGYGSKAAPGEAFTREKADAYLQRDLSPSLAWIEKNVPNATEGQRQALASFGYNLGTDDLDRLLPDIRAGNWASVASRLPSFNKALNERTGRLEPLEGLTTRRQREAALLGAAPAPQAGPTAAANILLQGGMLNEGIALQENARKQQEAAQAAQEKRQKEMWGVIGDLALAADTPEKWARAVDAARRGGLSVDGLDDFANRDLVLARSERMKTALELAKGGKDDLIRAGKNIYKKSTGEWITPPNTANDTGIPEGSGELGKDLRWRMKDGKYELDASGRPIAEPIPGGPKEAVSAETAARVGLADKFLNDIPAIQQEIAAGDLNSNYGVDFYLNRGKAGMLLRRIEDGKEALMRNLTGAGMNESEARSYAERFSPTRTDTTETIVSKLKNLESNLRAVNQRVMTGRGAASVDAAPPPAAVPTPGSPVRVSTPEEAMALPPGTEFVTPDGRVKVRP